MDINLPDFHREDHQLHFIGGAVITAGSTASTPYSFKETP